MSIGFEGHEDGVIENEDCLYLNVHTPNQDTCGTNSLPVIAWIYGGGFINGFSNDLLYGPDFLIEKCVIFVSMNYRLGAMGFLSLALPEYSGNLGLKDQQLALKWIYENIDAFGGNNKNITILGESAGDIITYLCLSISNNKLFCDKMIRL